jgi:DNA recombination protein RmuC
LDRIVGVADPIFLAVLAAAVLAAVAAIVTIVLLARLGGVPGQAAATQSRVEQLARDNERLERELREALAEGRRETGEAARAARAEQAQAIGQMSQTLSTQMAGFASVQNSQLDAFALRLGTLTESNDRRIGELREAVEKRLGELAAGNEKKLEEMRVTVDEKLHKTLESRLAESFKHVSERLEQVHKGLGEMQTLAAGVGDLKRVLSNVKTRGVLGEVQLAALLEQILTPGQYATNVATRPGANDRVEFAIRLPGRAEAEGVVWLPIDAKFPLEDYERLAKAQEAADAGGVEVAAKALEARIRLEARTIAEKYLAPPATTDFALLYLPFEGLYAEVLRRPGLFDALQREHRVTVCGPTTLTAILNSLQMGFRTLAIEQRSSEVWQILGAVKGEFAKFGEVLARTRKKLEEATSTIGSAEVRTRAIERKLRGVEALPSPQAAGLLEDAGESDAEPAPLGGNVVRLPEER